jgi:hypothetical protein
MPTIPALTASGSRELKRPRPIPRRVRDVITLMVYGRLDDEDCKPLDFIEAAKIAGLKPDQMRRWLDRAPVRALLRSERQAFRAAICAGNEQALQRVRDKSLNGMATVAAVRALEQIDETEPRNRGADVSPHLTIQIIQPPVAPAPPVTIEHAEPEPPRDSDGYRIDPATGERIFDPYRNGGL